MCKVDKIVLVLFASSHLILQAAAKWTTNSLHQHQLRRRMTTAHSALPANSVVICRVTLLDTLYASNAPSLETSHQHLCTPIVDDKQLQIDSIIQLPKDMAKTFTQEIARGLFIVSISDATLDPAGRLELGPSPSYRAVTDSRFDHHKERHLMTSDGTKTVAIVRVSTQNSEPADSVTSIQDTLFGVSSSSSSSPTISFVTQIEACSHGKLKLQQSDAGIIDVTLPGRKEDYDNDPSVLVTEAQLFLEQEGYGDTSNLGDRVVFCLPEGFGNWAARAGMNHWRMTMNNNWCLSLSAAMHEMGHTMGLGHNTGSDMGGYMGASYRRSDWPRKCYNAYNYHHTGWYNDRAIVWHEEMTSVSLVAFVDYPKTTSDESVLVNIADKYHVQYNVKKEFNEDSEMEDNLVTIHKPLPAEDTELLASLAVGESIRLEEPDVYVKVCEAYTTAGGADAVLVSFASDPSQLCQESIFDIASPEEDPSSMPSFAATDSPTVIHSGAPSISGAPSTDSSGSPPNTTNFDDFGSVNADTDSTNNDSLESLINTIIEGLEYVRGWGN